MALYHTAQGSVNYAVEGSPTIVDGIASGFTSSSYIRSEVQLPITDKNYECVIKCTPHTANRNGAVFGINNQFRIYFMLDKIEVGFFPTSGVYNYINISTDFTSGTYYYLKVKIQNDIASVSYSTDGVTYVSEHTITNEFKTTSGHVQYGYWGGDGWDPYNGSIDLNETYVTVNGQPWFGDCPIEVKKHQIMGPVGYTKVGSPTITDGVASSFSVDDYLSLSQSFSNASSFEMVFKVKFDSTLQGGIFHSNCIALKKYKGGNLELLYKNTSDSWQAIRGGGSLPQADTWCWIKAGYQSGSISLDFSSDGSLYTNVGTASYTLNNYNINSAEIGMHGSGNYFRGSVDLNETYIKENNELWFFQPAPTKYIIREDKNTHEQKLVFADQSMYLTGPVNYTVVGNPTIVDNVASGFSVSNYLQTTTPNNDISNLEFNVKINNFSHQNDNVIFKGDYSYQGFLINSEDKFRFVVYAPNETNVWQDVVCNYALTPGNGYIVNFALNNNTYTYNVYSLDKTLLHTQTGTFNFPWLSSSTLSIGAGAGWGYFDGSINFNETYIKVNGNLLFYGKNYASQNIAPVPGGYTLNNISHPYIGYVDMRDQSYHQAPAGVALVNGDGYATYDDYVVEDNKLVAVNPNIYWQNLTGGGGWAGFAYIDTGFKPTNNTAFEFAYTQKQTQGSNINTSPFIINGPTIEGVSFNVFGFNFQAATFNYFGDEKTVGAGEYNVKRIYKSKLDNNKNYYIYKTESGTTSLVFSASPASNQTTFGNLYLGCWHYGYDSGASVPYYPMLGNLYYAKFWENGVLIRHFVPVPAGLVIGNFTAPSNGMFDIANQQFYPNLGTGEFTIGRDE